MEKYQNKNDEKGETQNKADGRYTRNATLPE